jgi:hypothetical protein
MDAHLELRGLTKQHVDKAGGLQILDKSIWILKKGSLSPWSAPAGVAKPLCCGLSPAWTAPSRANCASRADF